MTDAGSRLVTGLGFAEGLRWHEGELWLSDFRARTVLSVDGDGRVAQRAYVPGQPSGIGWRPDGTLLVASMLDQVLVAIEDGARRAVASLGGVAVGPVNDMIVDGEGRAYVGSHGADMLYDEVTPENAAEKLLPSPLAVVSPRGEVAVAATDMRVPNGMALTSDGRLLVAESMGLCVTAFDVAADGTLSNRRVFAELAGVPDGLCIDREDAVWVALSSAAKFVRIAGGAVVEEIDVEGVPVDCTLGGADGRTLFGAVAYTGINVWSDGLVESGIHTWPVEVPAPAAALNGGRDA